jgi:seryl-tRNA synthetase
MLLVLLISIRKFLKINNKFDLYNKEKNYLQNKLNDLMYNGPNLLSDTVHIGEHDKDSKPINTFYKLTKKRSSIPYGCSTYN